MASCAYSNRQRKKSSLAEFPVTETFGVVHMPVSKKKSSAILVWTWLMEESSAAVFFSNRLLMNSVCIYVIISLQQVWRHIAFNV